MLTSGCFSAPAAPGPVPADPALFPDPIHDERTVTAAVGPADGMAAACSDVRPCFDYPFTLWQAALLNATASRTGDANGIALEVLGNDARIQFASGPLGTQTVTLQQVLDAGDYVLRLHAYRMVAGSYALDATFHPPPPPKLPIGPDPLLEQQWGLAMSRVPEAWAHATGKGVTIAFIDTGVDLEHPDLREKLVLIEGAAFVGRDLRDTNGHGTHVAGIAAATANNGIGIAGVAPDALIMPLRVLTVTGPAAYFEPGYLTQRDSIAQAIRLAADYGAHVISMSLASTTVPGDTSGIFAPQVDAALEYAWSKGLVMVAAAGNAFPVPQCADIAAHPRVLCVGAVDPSGQRATYSNLEIGQDFVVAPGGAALGSLADCSTLIISTVPPGAGSCAQDIDGAWYAGMSGTSMAAPFVAGIAALLLEQGLTNEQVVKRIKDTADPRVGLEDALPDPNPLYGHGLVDGFCAVTHGSGSGCS